VVPPFRIAPADPRPRAPHWLVRPGGWDTHAHVFGPVGHFPFHPDSPYNSLDQTAADYIAMLDAIGVTNGVLVQPSAYGEDNGCMLAALRTHPGRLVGVVDLDLLAQSDIVIDEMARAGVRGLRVRPANMPRDRLNQIAARLREIGWHLDLFIKDTAAMEAIAPHLRTLKLDIMVEAMGNPKAGQTLTDPGIQALVGLLRDGTVWAKLSHAYHIDTGGAPYPRSVPFARALVEAASERLVWGSDWPHPMLSGEVPNDGDLIDLLLDWAGDAETANAILCDNPLRFYGPPGAAFK